VRPTEELRVKFGRKGLCVLAVIFGLVLVGEAALAVEYNPGVSAGEYAKYGYSGTGEGLPLWMRLEVVAVSGKEVTLRMTGQITAEEAMPTSDSIWNVETGTMDGNAMCMAMVMAANLNQGDAVPPEECELAINKTETRTYLGAKRTVSVIMTDSEDMGKWTRVYDRETGMLLEMVTEMDSSTQTVSITETNLFPSTPIPEPGIAALAVAALLMVAVVQSRQPR